MSNVTGYIGPATKLVNSLLPPLTDAKALEAKRRLMAGRSAMADTSLLAFFAHITFKFELMCTRRDVELACVTNRNKLYGNPEWLVGYTEAEKDHVRKHWPAELKQQQHVAVREAQLAYSGVPMGEIIGTLCHEAMHPAMLYWDRMGSRKVVVQDKAGNKVMLWNAAHDYMINLMIEETYGKLKGNSVKNLTPPTQWAAPGLYDTRFTNMAAEQIYEILLEEMKQNEQNGSGGAGKGSAGAFPQDLSGKGDTEEEEEKDGEDAGQTPWGEHVDPGQYWQIAVLEAAQEHEKKNGRGTLPGQLQKLVDDIREPVVDWPIVLSRWVGENGPRADFSYARPNRRSESVGATLAGLRKHGCADVCVLWDSSGSMAGLEEEIMSEVIGICTDLDMTLRVIVIDSAIFSDQVEVEKPSDVNFGGGGGSDFRPAFERLDDEGFSGVVVAFTDGMIGAPCEPPPHLAGTLWVLLPGYDHAPAEWGAVLQIDENGKTKGTR